MGLFGFSDLAKKDSKIDERFIKKSPETGSYEYKKLSLDERFKILDEVNKKIVKDADYKSYGPGTHQYRLIWEFHPELQQEMIAFSKEISQVMWCQSRQQRIGKAVCVNQQRMEICSCEGRAVI